jgi:hypothetical protein
MLSSNMAILCKLLGCPYHEQMLEILSSGSSASSSLPTTNLSAATSSLTIVPKWEDVLVANNYQLLCKEFCYLIHENFLEDLRDGQISFNLSADNIENILVIWKSQAASFPAVPWMLYDDKIFHQVIATVRRQQTSSEEQSFQMVRRKRST